jgi:hypothetical protein
MFSKNYKGKIGILGGWKKHRREKRKFHPKYLIWFEF